MLPAGDLTALLYAQGLLGFAAVAAVLLKDRAHAGETPVVLVRTGTLGGRCTHRIQEQYQQKCTAVLHSEFRKARTEHFPIRRNVEMLQIHPRAGGHPVSPD